MSLSESIDLSREPLATTLLTDEQKERLTELLDRYLSSLEGGTPLDPSSLIKEHPDLAEPLEAYLVSLDELHCAAAGFGSANDNEVSTDDSADSDVRRLGDFVLGRELGRGGMGIVYEAQQLSLDRIVALKVLPFAAVLDGKQIARFKTEAQAAAQILHPNIVPVFAIGVDRSVHYYAMQFIDGQPLDRAIAEMRDKDRSKRKTRFKRNDTTRHLSMHEMREESAAFSSSSNNTREYFQTVARLGVQAADALHAAHEYGVVHRDIKPSNLLLDHAGKLWITDFGLARCQHDATFSKTGDIVGTMRYMSPEQASGKTSLIDQRTDIYSLGITLYELLALQPAIPGNDGAALLENIANQNPTSLRQHCPQIPVDLENVILKAMSAEREERYTTAREFADDLKRYLEGRPTVAKPPTTVELATKWMTRHKAIVATTIGIVLFACFGLAISTLLISREKSNTQANFERAEQNFRDARNAVDQFGAMFAERLAGIPGTDHVRHEMLKESLAYYQRFAEQAQDDPDLQADLAVTYSKIGTLTSELGAHEEAIAAHKHSIERFQQLAVASPKDSELHRQYATSQNKLATTLHRAGQLAEAVSAHRSAIAIQKRLVRTTPNGPSAGDLADSYSNIGLLLAESNNKAKARQAFDDAIEIQQRLLDAAPNDAAIHRSLAITFNNLSTVYLDTDTKQAEQGYRSAIKHQTAAVTANPSNLDCKSELAATYNNLGSLQSQQRRYDEAARSYQQAVAIQQQLLTSDPTNDSYRRDLSISYNNQGLMHSRLSNTNRAEESFHQAITIQLPLAAARPNDSALRSSLGGVYNNLGIVLEEQRQFNEAAASYRKAIEHQQAAFAQAMSVARYRIFLSKHYFNYGRVLRTLDQPNQAMQIALARRELWASDANRLFSVAEELALATQLLTQADNANEDAVTQGCSNVVETLEQAVAAGYPLTRDILYSEPFSVLQDGSNLLQLVSH